MANTLHPRVVADLASAGFDTMRRLDAAVLDDRDAAELIDLCVAPETYGVLTALGLEGGPAALSAALYRRVEGCRERADIQRRAQAATPFSREGPQAEAGGHGAARLGPDRRADHGARAPVRQTGALADQSLARSGRGRRPIGEDAYRGGGAR